MTTFRSPFTTPAAAPPVLEVSDPLGRLTTEDLEELFATNAPSESISRGISRPSTCFHTPRRNGSGAATTRMFDMSKFDRTLSSSQTATSTDTKSAGLFGPSPSSSTTTLDTQQQQRSVIFSVPPNSAASSSLDAASGQGTAFVFQSGGTGKPVFGTATLMFGGAFQLAIPADHLKAAVTPTADFGTGFPPYEPYMTYDATLNHGHDPATFHTICAMPAYAHKSPEEWRLEDYIKKEKGIPTPTSLKPTPQSFPYADVPRNPFTRHNQSTLPPSGSGVFSFVSSPVPRTQANISAFSSSSLFGSASASNASGCFSSTTAGTAAAATQGFGVASSVAAKFSPAPNENASLFGQATTPSALPTTTSPRFGNAQESNRSGFSFGGSGKSGFRFGSPSHDFSASSVSFAQSSSPSISFGGQGQAPNASGSLFRQSTNSGFSFGESRGSSISFGQSQGSSTPGSLFGQSSGSDFGFGQIPEVTNTPPLFDLTQNTSSSSDFQFGQSSSPGFGSSGQAQHSGTSSGFSFGGGSSGASPSFGSSQGPSHSGSLSGQPSDSKCFSFGGQQQPGVTTASLFGNASTGITETTALSFGSATTNAGDCDCDGRNVQQQPTDFKFGSETGNALARDSIGSGGGVEEGAGSWSFGYSASSSSNSSSGNSRNSSDNRDSEGVSIFNQSAAAPGSERKRADSEARPSSALRSTRVGFGSQAWSSQAQFDNQAKPWLQVSLLVYPMDATIDQACDEIRREEPVTLQDLGSHAITASLLHEKTEKLSLIEAARPLPLASIASQDASPNRPSTSTSSSARARHDESLILDTTGYHLPPRTHELFSQVEDQSRAIEAIDTSTSSPRSMPRFFFNPGSPVSSNSSDGSSLFGSPRALSTGARSTSSDYYGCDSTSSSRGGSPFGSPSGGVFPLFRFTFPKDARQPSSMLDRS